MEYKHIFQQQSVNQWEQNELWQKYSERKNLSRIA